MKNDNSLTNSLINNISQSSLLEDPFTHKFVTNVFPKIFYEEFINNIPDKNLYVPILETGSVTTNYSPERYVFNLLDKKNMEKLSNNQNIFFKKLLNTILSDEFFTSVTSQFRKTIDNRLKNLTSEEIDLFGNSNYKFTIRTSLVKDFTKYSLGAHTDSIAKFVTFLFYIPTNKNLANIGTSLYKLNNDNEKNFNSDTDKNSANFHFTMKETALNFTKVKTCSFIPNSLLVFPRTDKSYHGVEEVNINQKERNLLQVNYYIHKQ